jgi:hypothetical protein
MYSLEEHVKYSRRTIHSYVSVDSYFVAIRRFLMKIAQLQIVSNKYLW